MKKEFSDIYDAGTDPTDRANYIKNGSEEYEAVCFLKGANHKFDILKKYLAHSVNVGRDEYPKTIQGAYELLTHTASENQSVIGDTQEEVGDKVAVDSEMCK